MFSARVKPHGLSLFLGRNAWNVSFHKCDIWLVAERNVRWEFNWHWTVTALLRAAPKEYFILGLECYGKDIDYQEPFLQPCDVAAGVLQKHTRPCRDSTRDLCGA